ncbi:glycosyl hydrolases family 18-domain-containing protein [Aspergillus insuetus]
MAYDLHGIWDHENPIRSQVLPHTNLTKINLAMDLLWRNDVPASKVNLGLGFYGRAFKLADPACAVPGCLFKGGAAKGPCTRNSGTLSYREIMEIKNKYNIKPTYDKESGVKWISWNTNQWVSYDNQDTIQQKIKYANDLGLGGLLIWAINLNNSQLDALAGVLHPRRLGSLGNVAEDSANWQDINEGWCYFTECGVTHYKAGYISLETMQCGAPSLFANYGEATICCPYASAPDPHRCKWRGGDPFCNGRCHVGEVAIQSSKWGDGGWCTDGRKFYCCESETIQPSCRWTECGDENADDVCSSDEDELTWAYNTCNTGEWKRFCCSKEQAWNNYTWHGKPGSCFNNHCDTRFQVSLATLYEGEREDCRRHVERSRSFCCDPPKGQTPFMPVPLEYLFENPPPEDKANADFDLKVDPTWGGQRNNPFNADPDDAPFGFIIMVSPEEIQVSLDKRDGSHWEVFNCEDTKQTKQQHTVQMVCTKTGDGSNCHKIHLGHGVPGTILQMPSGCGPGKYAVAHSLQPSWNQSMPGHLARRGITETVYNLTFDYDFRRVPRDLGDTQLRIDYSNDQNYWGGVVNKAASKKRKRTLHEIGGNHHHWLEEEWRDNLHFGALSREDLHKRWFGEDVIDWLQELIRTVSTTVEYSHTYNKDFTLSIINERLTCPNFDAVLEVYAQAHVKASVNYGFTLITKLEWPINLSNSYLYFRTRGEVTTRFVVDAAVRAFFNTGNREIFAADKFGATFSIPGIVTIGPNFKLLGQLEGSALLGVKFQSLVKLAEWDIQQTYPVPNKDWEPEASRHPDKDNTQSLFAPEFEYGLTLSGHLTAHIKPTITFGIEWNQDFLPLDDCAVNVVADGHVTFHAEGKTGSSGTEFCYGVGAGADLYATIDAPSAFDWATLYIRQQVQTHTNIPLMQQRCLWKVPLKITRG